MNTIFSSLVFHTESSERNGKRVEQVSHNSASLEKIIQWNMFRLSDFYTSGTIGAWQREVQRQRHQIQWD